MAPCERSSAGVGGLMRLRSEFRFLIELVLNPVKSARNKATDKRGCGPPDFVCLLLERSVLQGTFFVEGF